MRGELPKPTGQKLQAGGVALHRKRLATWTQNDVEAVL
jgi:hypothetical protein